jgi:predicted nucleic acid-binding protein
MRVLLDTNVISEPTKPRPNPALMDWIKSQPSNESFISVLTLGEIHRGLDKMPRGARRSSLAVWLDDTLREFAGRLLPVDARVAELWGKLDAAAAQTIAPIDGLLAATALAHNLVLATRNVRHFAHANVRVIDPWND